MMYVGCMIVIHCNWTNIDPPTTRGKTDQSDFSSNLELEKLSAGSKSKLGLEREGFGCDTWVAAGMCWTTHLNTIAPHTHKYHTTTQ